MSGFDTTQWNAAFPAHGDAGARAALELLCRTYRPPVFIYIRHHGYGIDTAEDLTQRFFTHLLEHGFPIEAGVTQGRLRAFVLIALKRFLINVEQENRALKRGGHLRFESITDDGAPFDRIAAQGETPERAFEREWARVLLQTALHRLREEAAQAGRAELFDHVRDFLVEPPARAEYAATAAALQLRRNTLAVAVHRMRRRLCELVREELAATTPGDDLDRELHELGAALEPAMRQRRSLPPR